MCANLCVVKCGSRGGESWILTVSTSILEASSLALEIIIVTPIVIHPVSTALVSTAEGPTLLVARAASSSLLVLLRAIAIVVEAGRSVLTMLVITNLLVES